MPGTDPITVEQFNAFVLSPYFHGNISRAQAEARLQNVGDYLFRLSNARLTMSIKHADRIEHNLIGNQKEYDAMLQWIVLPDMHGVAKPPPTSTQTKSWRSRLKAFFSKKKSRVPESPSVAVSSSAVFSETFVASEIFDAAPVPVLLSAASSTNATPRSQEGGSTPRSTENSLRRTHQDASTSQRLEKRGTIYSTLPQTLEPHYSDMRMKQEVIYDNALKPDIVYDSSLPQDTSKNRPQ